MPYGSLYFGKTGFFYKKSVTSARKNPPIGLLNCGSTDIFNKYTPGAGVGAQNRSVRRAKMRLATSCENTYQSCGQYFAKLGLNQNAVSRYTINRNFVYPPWSYYLGPGAPPSIVCDNLPQDTPYETCAPWPHFGGLYNTNSRLTPLTGPSQTSAPTNSWSYITNTEIYSSPVIGEDGTIYISSGSEGFDVSGNVYAINADGILKWSYEATGPIYGSCAIGKDGTIYVAGVIPFGEGGAGIVYAFNPNNGSVKWTFSGFPTNGATLASPTIGTDGTIYVASLDNYLYAINPNGTLKWESPSAGDSYYLICPAIGQDGTIYAAAADGIRAFNPVDGSIKWAFGLSAYSSPAIGPDGSIYISDPGSGRFIKRDQSGNVLWNVPMISYPVEVPQVSSPAIDSNGIIYLANTTFISTGYIIAIDPVDGSTIWQTNYPDPFLSSVTIDGNGTLFVVSGGGDVLALNSTNGTELWRFDTVGSPWSSVSIGQNNTLYISLFEGILALF
jgi:outer membrane protein assembly factor BamB